MARYLGPKMKVCRRFGLTLWDRAERYFAKRDLQAKRTRRRKTSEYGVRLEEKEKVKLYYGVLDRQFRRYYSAALRMSGNTGLNLMTMLEQRLDNVVFRSGFAVSREQARQMIVHGHVRVDGQKVDRPSFLVRPEMIVTAGKKEASKIMFKLHQGVTKSSHKPSWIEIQEEGELVKARILAMPTREEIELQINEQLIIELLSK
jgi:small subunit ribosomal protein S4